MPCRYPRRGFFMPEMLNICDQNIIFYFAQYLIFITNHKQFKNMETELNTKKNRLHDEAYWAQVTEELEREEEEEIEVLLEEMINQQ